MPSSLPLTIVIRIPDVALSRSDLNASLGLQVDRYEASSGRPYAQIDMADHGDKWAAAFRRRSRLLQHNPGQSGPCAPSAMIGSRLYLAGQLRRDFPLRSFEDVVEKTGMAVCDLGGRIAFGVAFLRSPSSILHLGTIIAQLWSTVYSCDSICCGAFRRFSLCFFCFSLAQSSPSLPPFCSSPFLGAAIRMRGVDMDQ